MTSNKPATPSAKDELLQLLELLRVEGGQPNKAAAHRDRLAVEKVEAEAVVSLTTERDKARDDYRWMVEHAADAKLDGYRDLGNRAAEAEANADGLTARLTEGISWAWGVGDELDSNHARWVVLQLADRLGVKVKLPPENKPNNRLREQLAEAETQLMALRDASELSRSFTIKEVRPGEYRCVDCDMVMTALYNTHDPDCDVGQIERVLANTAAAARRYAEKLEEGWPSAERITEVLRGHVLTLNAVGVVCGNDYPGCQMAAIWPGGPGGPGRHHSMEFKGFDAPYCDGEMHGSHWGWIPETLAEHLARAFRQALGPGSEPKKEI